MDQGILVLLQFCQNKSTKGNIIKKMPQSSVNTFTPVCDTKDWPVKYNLTFCEMLEILLSTTFINITHSFCHWKKQKQKLLTSLKYLSVMLGVDVYTFPREAALDSVQLPTLCWVLIPRGSAEKRVALYISPALDFHLAPIQLLTLLSL